MEHKIEHEIMSQYNKNCECCGKKVKSYFRFTNWYDESNDYESEDLKTVIKKYIEAINDDRLGRFSIYDLSSCGFCEMHRDEGIFYNKFYREE